MAEDQEDTQQEARSTAPPPEMTLTEKVWLTIRMDPGISNLDCFKRCVAAGIRESSASPFVNQLVSRGRVAYAGVTTGTDSAGRACKTKTLVALGSSRNPEVQKWLETLPDYEDLISRARVLHAAAKSNPPVPIRPNAGPPRLTTLTPVSPADKLLPWHLDPATETKLAKLSKLTVVRWRDFEIENVCRKLAREHVLAGRTIDHKLLARVVKSPGFGYRCRDLHYIPEREKFLSDHKPLIKLMVAEVQEQWTAAKNAAHAAPEPEPEQHEPVINTGEAERVVAATDTLKLEIEPQGAPIEAHEHPSSYRFFSANEPLGMILSGLQMLARGLIGEVVREELAKLPQANLQPLHDQVHAAEQRISDAIGSLETTLGIRKLTHPDMGVLKLAPTPPTPPSAPKEKRKPVVCIVGGNSGQMESIKKDFDRYLDLRFYSGDRVPNEVDPVLVVAFSRFIEHPTEKSCKTKYGEKYMGIHGAATAIKMSIAQRLGIPIVQHH